MNHRDWIPPSPSVSSNLSRSTLTSRTLDMDLDCDDSPVGPKKAPRTPFKGKLSASVSESMAATKSALKSTKSKVKESSRSLWSKTKKSRKKSKEFVGFSSDLLNSLSHKVHKSFTKTSSTSQSFEVNPGDGDLDGCGDNGAHQGDGDGGDDDDEEEDMDYCWESDFSSDSPDSSEGEEEEQVPAQNPSREEAVTANLNVRCLGFRKLDLEDNNNQVDHHNHGHHDQVDSKQSPPSSQIPTGSTHRPPIPPPPIPPSPSSSTCSSIRTSSSASSVHRPPPMVPSKDRVLEKLALIHQQQQQHPHQQFQHHPHHLMSPSPPVTNSGSECSSTRSPSSPRMNRPLSTPSHPNGRAIPPGSTKRKPIQRPKEQPPPPPPPPPLPTSSPPPLTTGDVNPVIDPLLMRHQINLSMATNTSSDAIPEDNLIVTSSTPAAPIALPLSNSNQQEEDHQTHFQHEDHEGDDQTHEDEDYLIPTDGTNSPWFRPNLTRCDAEKYLLSPGDFPEGSFIVRPGASDTYPYSLSLLHDHKVYHLNVRKLPDGCHFSLGKGPGGRIFISLHHLITYYGNKPLLLVSSKNKGNDASNRKFVKLLLN